jgi:hypothetical protein
MDSENYDLRHIVTSENDSSLIVNSVNNINDR